MTMANLKSRIKIRGLKTPLIRLIVIPITSKKMAFHELLINQHLQVNMQKNPYKNATSYKHNIT